MRKSSGTLLSIYQAYDREKRRYQRIKEDFHHAPTYRGYAIQSIIFSSLMMASSASIYLLPSIQSNNVLVAIMIILLLIFSALLLPLIFGVYAFAFSILQLKLNKCQLGWFALIFYLISLAPTLYMLLTHILAL